MQDLIKLIGDTFSEEVHATVGDHFGSPSAHIEGKDEFLKKIEEKLNPTTKVLATGFVYGNHWGGGEGGYPAEKLEGATKEEVIQKAKAGVENGSLDSGMGYESLIGAVLTLHIITRIEVGNRTFENIEYETVTIGELTESQEQLLLEQL